MKTITGQFFRFKGTEWEEPANGAILNISLPRSQKDIAIGDGPPIEELPEVKIVLDEQGRVPEGTEILGCEELRPEGILYEIILSDNEEYRGECIFEGYSRIVGTSPINLNEIAIEKWEEPPVSFPLAPPPPRRPVPSNLKPGYNPLGFFAGSIYSPASTRVVTVAGIKESFFSPSIRKDEETWKDKFSVFGFHLPSKSAISCVTLEVADAAAGSRAAIGLYSLAGKKKCETVVDLGQNGLSTGYFPELVHLEKGEYYFAFGVAYGQLGAQFRDPLSLVCYSPRTDFGNAGGGRIIAGVAAGLCGTSLPEEIGPITPDESIAIPVAFLKS